MILSHVQELGLLKAPIAVLIKCPSCVHSLHAAALMLALSLLKAFRSWGSAAGLLSSMICGVRHIYNGRL